LMGGVDEQAVFDFVNSHDGWCDTTKHLYFDSLWTKKGKLTDLFRQAVDDGVLLQSDGIYIQAFSVPGMPGVLSFNCPEAFQLHAANDADCVTQVALRCRAATKRLLKFFKKYCKGFDNAFIMATAPMPGVRESRRLVGRYVVTVDDYNNRVKFGDAIAQSAYPIDVHGGEREGFAKGMEKGEYMEVPYRCLLPVEIDNLLVAGRCASADFFAQSALRIQLVCRAMGEAAGLAAAMSAASGAPVCDIDGAAVRTAMIAGGGQFVK